MPCRETPTSSRKDLVCGTRASHCGRTDERRVCPTNVHLPATRTEPIRSLPLGSNRLSFKYTDHVPVETGLGTLINTTDWINVVDLNLSTYLPGRIHHGIEFFRTPHLEIPWRLLDQGFVEAGEQVMWYVVPVGASVGVFYFVASTVETTTTGFTYDLLHTIHHLLEDDDADLGAFIPPVVGTVSIDTFISRVLHQPAWLIYNALATMIPQYMTSHSITKASISNRKHRIIRMQ